MINELNNYPELNKKYKAIIFDWDGTAVKNRQSDVSALLIVIKKLLEKNIFIIIITGTNFENVNNQFCSLIEDSNKQNLFICTNRGSEVWGYNQKIEIINLYRLKATQKQNILLDKVAQKVKKEVENSSNAKIKIIYNRLNRRKIDFYSLWKDPPKEEFDKLLCLTEKYLKENGFSGGLKKAYNLTLQIAKSMNFKEAKITSDIKHIEVGLSDKSDSIKWILAHIAKPLNISNDEILILGDEFGTISGFQGSDYKMVLDEEANITYISVGIEPKGVPEGIIHIKGGPAIFLEILQKQINL